MKRICLILCGAFALASLRAASAADVTATLEPAQVAVGEPAQLTVTVTGSTSAEPTIPNIAGLDIAHIGQSTQIQVVNGSMSASSVQTYEVTPEHAGTFTIPAIKAGSSESRPLTLHVTGNGGGNPANGNPQSSGGSTVLPAPPNASPPSPDDAGPPDARYGFVQFAVPKKECYVGELVPVDINVLIPAGVRVAGLNGLPALAGEGFALNQLSDKPEQNERVFDGREYTVLTWHSAVTAVKPGDFSLSMHIPISVIVREQAQPRHRAGGDPFDQFFNDPFFDDPFAARARKKEVTLGSETADLTVLPLPAANRPADFSGAVGHFDLRASASPTNVTAGDPITLRLELSGSGDFDRANSGVLPNGNGWKTYTPKGSFQADDSAGYQGTKTFEQLVIPEDPTEREIPALRFSFFDPKTRQYETRTTAPIPVTVKAPPVSLTASMPAPAANNGLPTAAAPDLVPNKVEPGHFVATLTPVFLSPWFVAGQALPLGALAGGLLLLRRRRRYASDPRLGRANAAERAIQAQLERMDQAMRQHASADFFASARSALQQRLGERWNVRPETITLAEIKARLNGAGEGIRPIFEMADQVSYSGHTLGEADYRQWKDLVVAQLKALEKQA